MFLLKLSRPTAVSLKPELWKAAACVLSLSPPPYNTPREFYTASLVVGVPVCIFFSLYSWDEAEFDFRYSAKTATHTCVAVIWCERQHTCFQFLSSTWQFEIRSGKTISLLGSMKYRIIISLRISGLRLISEHLRRSGSSFSFRFCWKMIFLMESNCFNCKVTEVTRVNSSLLYNKRNTSCLYNLLACLL